MPTNTMTTAERVLAKVFICPQCRVPAALLAVRHVGGGHYFRSCKTCWTNENDALRLAGFPTQAWPHLED